MIFVCHLVILYFENSESALAPLPAKYRPTKKQLATCIKYDQANNLGILVGDSVTGNYLTNYAEEDSQNQQLDQVPEQPVNFV